MDEFSSRRQSSDGRQECTFFIRRLQVMDLFRVLIKETIRRLNVMVQVMDLFRFLIMETIMRLQVTVGTYYNGPTFKCQLESGTG